MKNIFAGIKGARVRRHEQLAKYTSFNIGGRADYLIRVSSLDALKKVVAIIKRYRLRYLVIGAGTNLLFGDRGFHGIIIKLSGNFCRITMNGRHFVCGAGASLRRFLRTAADNGYGGAEYLAGIPGTIGGAIKGNAGAFGKWVSNITNTVTVLDSRLKETILTNTEVGFGYRSTNMDNNSVILYAEFKLARRKRNLIKAEMKKYLHERRRKHPSGMCAGSFFKNPLPHAAGKLIDECGLKGLRIGNAAVSLKHGNFIMNVGNARASDVLKLARYIKRVIRAKKGIVLEEEIKVIR